MKTKPGESALARHAGGTLSMHCAMDSMTELESCMAFSSMILICTMMLTAQTQRTFKRGRMNFDLANELLSMCVGKPLQAVRTTSSKHADETSCKPYGQPAANTQTGHSAGRSEGWVARNGELGLVHSVHQDRHHRGLSIIQLREARSTDALQ